MPCRHDLVEGFLQCLKHVLVLLVNLVEDGLALVYWRVLNLGTQFVDFLLERRSRVLYILLNLLALGAELIVGELLYLRRDLLDFLYEGLNEAHVSFGLIAKDGF